SHLRCERRRRGDRGGGRELLPARGRQDRLHGELPRHPPVRSLRLAGPELMDEFDFIVVGTGSAGSCVASRLSEISDVSVLALEAGGEPYPPNVSNPALWFTLFGSDVDWGYLRTPQKALGGRPAYQPRG